MFCKNKGADQFRGYRETNLSLCFRIKQNAGFLMTRLINNFNKTACIPSDIDSTGLRHLVTFEELRKRKKNVI